MQELSFNTDQPSPIHQLHTKTSIIDFFKRRPFSPEEGDDFIKSLAHNQPDVLADSLLGILICQPTKIEIFYQLAQNNAALKEKLDALTYPDILDVLTDPSIVCEDIPIFLTGLKNNHPYFKHLMEAKEKYRIPRDLFNSRGQELTEFLIKLKCGKECHHYQCYFNDRIPIIIKTFAFPH